MTERFAEIRIDDEFDVDMSDASETIVVDEEIQYITNASPMERETNHDIQMDIDSRDSEIVSPVSEMDWNTNEGFDEEAIEIVVEDVQIDEEGMDID
jgi:hypothetical protein